MDNEDRTPIRPTGPEFATEEDFGPRQGFAIIDGVEMSPEEAADIRRQVKLAPLVEEVDSRDLDFLEDPVNLSTPVLLRCACDRKKEFRTTLYALEKCKRPCPRCREAEIEEKHHRIAADNGLTMTSPYSGVNKETQYTCDEGHAMFATPNQIARGMKCPVCHPPLKSKAEEKITAVLAEQGMNLVRYHNAESPITASLNGEKFTFNRPELYQRKGPFSIKGKVMGAYCDHTNRAFFYMERDEPRVLTDALESFLATAETEELGTYKTAIATADALSAEIEFHVKEGWNVLNVQNNPQWKRAGTYTWGKFE